ncbi:inositol phosphate phosphatase SopB [Paraburkholderia bonniea]|uniref:inositol phosphate phosphatase SopB n=1 Tax=Paraburkholderia bonniea TaxID=2152891 RepID=UPI002572A13B|nr:inositol phosphate phosphatase SopB [Paraburkholderia bonniea]WJF89331.1 inositol phosphate phosphatase SopB [Paraburkholderia bonniea]WJF92647.1 inositol phosphate phosphatase SopB [Paraburkholderia bonniea]
MNSEYLKNASPKDVGMDLLYPMRKRTPGQDPFNGTPLHGNCALSVEPPAKKFTNDASGSRDVGYLADEASLLQSTAINMIRRSGWAAFFVAEDFALPTCSGAMTRHATKADIAQFEAYRLQVDQALYRVARSAGDKRSQDKLSKKLKRAMAQERNRQRVSVIRREVRSGDILFHSTMTPASQLPALKSRYDKIEENIFTSGFQESAHATNLWSSTCELEDPVTGELKEVSSVLRLAVNAPQIPGASPEEVRAAAVERTLEVLLVAAGMRAPALATTEGQPATEGAEVVGGPLAVPTMSACTSGAKPVKIKLVPISILTPTKGMPEGDMTRLQFETYKKLNDIYKDGGTIKLNGSDDEITEVSAEFFSFSTGVNAGAMLAPDGNTLFGRALGFIFAPLTEYIGGWDYSDTINAASLPGFFAAAREHATLEKSSASTDAEKALAESLAEEIEGLIGDIEAQMKDKRHHTPGKNPYLLPLLLALLAQRAGCVPVINCKSGKDRTAWLDSLIKAYNLQIERSRNSPHLQNKRPEGTSYLEWISDTYEISGYYLFRELFCDIAVQGGSMDIQLLSTGFKGYKVFGLGTPEAMYQLAGYLLDELIGLSRLTSS